MAKRPPSLSKAQRAFSAFTGHRAKKAYSAPLDEGAVAGYRMGSMVGVAYEATRDGKTERYFHEFKKAARPDLVAKDDGQQLFITGGKYRVTNRGIEDTPHMASRLFVVNPSARRRRKRRASPSARRKSVSIFTTNPTRRRRRARPMRRARVARYRRNPVMVANPKRRRRMARYRRNPISLSGGGKGGIKIMSLFVPAATVGLGAVGVEMLMGFMPIPPQLKTGPIKHVTKGAIAVAIGWGLGKFVSKRLGEAFALGGLTIAVHDAAKDQILRMAPNVRFGQYENRMGEYMGQYIGGDEMYENPAIEEGTGAFGYSNAGQVVDGSYF